ncbi:carbohydrate ABC transporter permease [Actinomadura darangshiensis]|uniref:Carbohydrate ABC transporter permease n=1 Tax=Actinomadura darangshiensis TaxID=705336 RepID=A0A4R5B0N2_9ACTN|nr:carbohydrate ABC transporter permease [Actinomadura darangshiensis]TDD77686.1 carbohydrate ABC transporter permease [Actinomadura darangshiensis]
MTVSEPRARRLPRLSATGVYTSLIVAAVVVILPLTVVLFTSMKTPEELASGESVLAPPDDWFNFGNYATAFQRGHIARALLNTTIILVVSVTGTVFIGSMAAYAIDRFRFRFRSLVLGLFLFATLVPSITTQVTTFQVIDQLGLFNTRLAPIALYMGTDIVAIYIFLQFIRGIPASVDEAARIDGASYFTIYRRIILPLMKPAIATVVIVKGIAVYNDFYIPFLYMPDSRLGTMSTALFRFKGPSGAHWEQISAGTILVIVPTLVVFLALQRFIYSGLTKGTGK